MVRPTRGRGASSAAAEENAERKEDAAPAIESSNTHSSSASDSTSTAASTDCSAVEPCVICLEDIEGAFAALDQCSHKFHPPCILHWASITNLCPLCKTRFKHIKEINPAAVVAPVRAGLRGRGAKVVRVATKNQSVEWSSSSEEEGEEEEEEEEQPRPRVRRAAASRRVTARAPAAHSTRSTRSSATTRSTRSRSRKQQSDDEEETAAAEEEEEDECKGGDEEEDDEYLPNTSEVEGDASPNIEEMNEEEMLAFAIKESLKITDSANSKPATKSAASSSTTSRRVPVRRGRAASHAVKNDVDECKESHVEEEDDDEEEKPAKKSSSRTARSTNARGATRRKRTLVDEEDEEEEEKSEKPSSLPASSSSSSIQWIRTRDGRWTRSQDYISSTRSTALSVDSLMAQHLATEKAKTASSFSSSSSSSSSSSYFLSASNSSIPAAPQPKSATNAAMSQADDALSSFELRILQHKRAKQSAALITNSVLDLTDEHETSTTHLPLNLASPSSIASDSSVVSSQSSATSAASSSFSATSASTTQESEYTPSVCVPGGLNVWRRKRQSELHPNSAEVISSFEEKDDDCENEANISAASSNDSGSLDRTMNYDRDSLPSSPDREDIDLVHPMIPGGISGMHVTDETENSSHHDHNKENDIDDRFEAPSSSLWSRVSQFISNSLTPSKLAAAATAAAKPSQTNASKLGEHTQQSRQRQPLKDRN